MILLAPGGLIAALICFRRARTLALFGLAVLVVHACAAHADPTLSVSDFDGIARAGGTNQLAFEATYKGRTFSGQLYLATISRSGNDVIAWLSLSKENDWKEVLCNLSQDQRAVGATWRVGDLLFVTGTISLGGLWDKSSGRFGQFWLTGCQITPAR